MSRQEKKAVQPFLQEPVSEVIPQGSQKESSAVSVLEKARLESVESKVNERYWDADTAHRCID
ncbi:hypothetical protein PInf_022434 [Phytophthora infestans]|nr:hypothetical protein PInf_022434 [Phytophthora infestans]